VLQLSAAAGYGTALGVIRAASADGKQIHVFVDETRPVLQGARLTAWELMRDRDSFHFNNQQYGWFPDETGKGKPGDCGSGPHCRQWRYRLP